jgi:HEAT repeat protein
MSIFGTIIPLSLILTTIALFGIAVLSLLLYRRSMKRIFTQHLKEAVLHGISPLKSFDYKTLRKYKDVLGKLQKELGFRLEEVLDMKSFWIKEVSRKGRSKDVERLLAFYPREGLYTIFEAALKKSKLLSQLIPHLKGNGLLKTASGASGEPFDAVKALHILEDRIPELRELSGHPLWKVRFFSINILLEHSEARTDRSLCEAFDDPHPYIRRLIAEELEIPDKDLLVVNLKNLVENDCSAEVRAAAWHRLQVEFPEQSELNLEDKTKTQILHMLDFLTPQSEQHINLAMQLLSQKDHELRLPAAQFLESAGMLRQILDSSDFRDDEQIGRNTSLLTNAADVQVSNFLYPVPTNPASLYVGLQILAKYGSRTLIVDYAQKCFKEFIHQELWNSAVEAICLRGDVNAYQVLAQQLSQVKSKPKERQFILDRLPPESDSVMAPVLLEMLKDDNFQEYEALEHALVRCTPSLIIKGILEIVKGDHFIYSHKVRLHALRVLAGFKLPYAIQTILEQLSIVPLEEAREFAELLSSFNTSILETRIRELFEQSDGQLRAALISTLTPALRSAFVSHIREGLKDSSPNVRRASAIALSDMGDNKSYNIIIDLLRDPVEDVRVEAARILSVLQTEAAMKALKNLIQDENEVEPVVKAAILGLAKSGESGATEVLAQIINEGHEHLAYIIASLAKYPSKSSVQTLTEEMKDAEPSMREKITKIFIEMGFAGEKAIRELLTEGIESLQPYLAEILEATGYIEHLIRKLGHRRPDIRKDAASILAKLHTTAAFRGIVLAARDPDKEVRIEVTRALERLAGPEGIEILKELRNDPDKKVRKYTEWALERTKVKAKND